MNTLTNSSPPTSSDRSAIPGLRVSVLVPTFNRAHYIAECLDSLLAQTMPALEIIVIDDGSEDDTAEVLTRYGQRIRYVRKDNGGKPTAVNLGLSMAQGELIWIFDDDDVALPDAIVNRVAALQARPDAGFVYTPHFYGSDGADGKIHKGRPHELPTYAPENFLFELMKGCFFHLATALVRADAYRAVGGFDTQLLSSEDYDIQLRLALTYAAAYCSEPSFIFRQHSGLRGAGAIRYGGNQRTTVFRRFDQRVGKKLKANVPLADYLVPRQAKVLDRADQRQALLGRMTVMASKGCLPEMMDDLQSVLTLLPPNLVPEPAVLGAITEAICTGYAGDAITNQWDDFKTGLAALPPTPAGRAVVRSIATGFLRLAKGYPAPLPVRWMRLKQACLVTMYSFISKDNTV